MHNKHDPTPRRLNLHCTCIVLQYSSLVYRKFREFYQHANGANVAHAQNLNVGLAQHLKFTMMGTSDECSKRCAMAKSIIPDRTSPYSEDLRWRMIWQRLDLGHNIKTVPSNLRVDPSTCIPDIVHYCQE